MRRSVVNFVLDGVSLAVMLGMIATGLLVRFILPPASRGGQGQTATVWSLDRHEWGDIHFWLAMTLIALMLVHVALHWSWVIAVVRSALRRPSGAISVTRRAALGAVTTLLCIVATAAFLWAASANVQTTGGSRAGRNRADANLTIQSAPDDNNIDTSANRNGAQQRLRRGWQGQ